MSRIGTCLQCGQRYADIPDSVTAARVKCKVCAGVVEIPPLAGAAAPVAAPAAPAAQPAPAPPKPVAQPAPIPPRPVAPARPAGVIPTKPIFAPKAPVKPVVPLAKPAAPPPRPPVAAPPARPPVAAPPVSRPAPPAPRPAAPAVRPAAAAPPAGRVHAQPAPIVKRAPTAPAAAPKPSAAEILAAAKAKRAAAQAASAAPAARSAAPAAVMHGGTRRTKREEREHQSYQKPRSNTPLILTVVLLLVGAGAGGLWYMVNKSEEANKPAPAAPTVIATPPAQPAAVPAASSVPAPAPAQPGASAPPPAANPQPATDPGAQPETPAAPAAAAFDANYVFVIPEAGKPLPVPTGSVDPAKLTLEKAPPLQRWSKTSDATWTSIQADLALYLDNSGARSNRAGEALVKIGRDSYPAIVTAIMKQDYTTVDGVKMAGSLSDLIGKIVGESNFVWRSAERHPIGSAEWTDTVLWQKKAAILRYNRWIQKLRDGDGEWEAIAKKGGASSRKDEEGNVVGEVPPDVPPDLPPPDGGR